MAIILFEEQEQREKFYPLTFTRPFAQLHAGLYSIKEWWEKFTGEHCSLDIVEGSLLINSHLLPAEDIWDEIQHLTAGTLLRDSAGHILALRNPIPDKETAASLTAVSGVDFIETPQQLLQHHAKMIERQFHLKTKGRSSQQISQTNHLICEENIFIEDNVEMEYATLNAREGAIYIGAGTVVMEGSMVRGALALGDKCVVKMGAKIYGATSTGSKCTLGGEIKNTIFHHGSNKAHDGYLGDSIIGSWCNFGAGASVSNVKNTAGHIGLYDYLSKTSIASGKKMGLLMGDYSRFAINSTVNTGSSVGVCCNVFGSGLLPKFIPNFSWGTDNKHSRYRLEDAIIHIDNWMDFKGEKLGEKEIQVLKHIFEGSESL